MTDSMIERVAKAIDAASQPAGKPDYKILMENCARAAIEAMREPTERMLAAGMKEEGVDLLSEWKAMIDDALKDNSVS